jgi:large subunit ribosomal protein L5e
VKFRRRREGRTDYRQRHKLITQDKNKFNCPKYRLVVRFSNRFVLCQIVSAEVIGDKVLCSASSQELGKHGLTVGLKNYSAAYCTGLLVARRWLKKIGLDELYPGVEEPTGKVDVSSKEQDELPAGKTKVAHSCRKYFMEFEKLKNDDEEFHEKNPFRCLLDVGIKNTTTGARVFGAMKGASDGGLDIPHSEKRFPGYTRDTKQFDAEAHKGHIMGEHVADYMREMEEDDEENYKKHFAKYLEAEVEADDLEELYEKVHASIREDPTSEAKGDFTSIDKNFRRMVKKTPAQRKADAATKKAGLRSASGLGGADDEDEDAMEEDDE